jgi:CheY-like chemotaxis protein
MAILLRLWGHDPRTASDGKSALETAAAFRPQLVLLDLGLPGMDGYEVARRLRHETAEWRPLIVAMSGYAGEGDRRHSHEAGCDLHLAKPADPGCD